MFDDPIHPQSQIAQSWVAKIVELLPPLALAILKAAPEVAILAGGFVRDGIRLAMLEDDSPLAQDAVKDMPDRAMLESMSPKDCDLFFNGPASLNPTVQTLLGGGEGAWLKPPAVYRVPESQNAGIPIQIITGWPFPDVTALLNSFDFQWCKCAITWTAEGWRGWCDYITRQDIQLNRLAYTRPFRAESPFASIIRACDFSRRFGCTIERYEWTNMLVQALDAFDRFRNTVLTKEPHRQPVRRQLVYQAVQQSNYSMVGHPIRGDETALGLEGLPAGLAQESNTLRQMIAEANAESVVVNP